MPTDRPSPPPADQVEAAQVLARHPRLLAWLDIIHAAAVGHGVSMASWAAFIGELKAAVSAPGTSLTYPADTGVMRPYYVDDVKYETTFSKLMGMQITARIPYFNPVYWVVLEHEPEHPWREDRMIGPSDWVDIPTGNPAKFYTIPPATFGGPDPYGLGAPTLPVECPTCKLEISAAECGSAHCPLKDAAWNRRGVAALRPVAGVAPEGMRLPPVEMIETVDYSTGFKQPADPMWRVNVSGYCADFETETAANNFRAAILALYSPPASRGLDNIRDCGGTEQWSPAPSKRVGAGDREGVPPVAPEGMREGVARIAEAIADGFSNGNQQYRDATPDQQRRYDDAALAVAALPLASGSDHGPVGWRPIEYHDGSETPVDLWCKRDWNPPESHERVVDFYFDRYLKRWRNAKALHFVDDLEQRGLTATHFMERPAPPGSELPFNNEDMDI